MAYAEIKDFRQGLDTTRDPIVGDSGTLHECINAHITRGGDVQSAKAFVEDTVLASGSFGLHKGPNKKLYVFGSDAAPTNLPGHIIYQRLQHASSGDMVALLDAENYNGVVTALAEFDDGNIYAYYDGARITDWDTQAAAIMDNEAITQYLTEKIDDITGISASRSGLVITVTGTPGTAYTIASTETGTGTIADATVQAAVAETAEVVATGSFEITGGFYLEGGANNISSITADGTELLDANVEFITNVESTALSVVNAINAGTDTHGYSASRSAAVITISAPAGTGATANGDVLAVTANGALTVGSVTNFASGVTYVAPVPQIDTVTIGGTAATTNSYTVTINGTGYTITGLSSGYPRILRTHKTKMHYGTRALDVFSAVDDPTSVSSGTGKGDINISSQDEGSDAITGYGVYQNLLAVFSEDNIQLWAHVADPTNNAIQNVIGNTGTRAKESIIRFTDADLMYLADDGIRSLRAREGYDSPFTEDVGTSIDESVTAFLATLTDAQIRAARAVTVPKEGRAWMAIANRIFVFSYFPGKKISAWSWYEPGFSVDGLAVANKRVYCRSGDTIYIYGGSADATYPAEGESTVTVQTQFLDAKRIAGEKQLKGMDLIVQGQWTVQLLVDPRDETKVSATITVDGPTPLSDWIPLCQNTTHFAFKLTSTAGGELKVSSLVMHFDDTETT